MNNQNSNPRNTPQNPPIQMPRPNHYHHHYQPSRPRPQFTSIKTPDLEAGQFEPPQEAWDGEENFSDSPKVTQELQRPRVRLPLPNSLGLGATALRDIAVSAPLNSAAVEVLGSGGLEPRLEVSSLQDVEHYPPDAASSNIHTPTHGKSSRVPYLLHLIEDREPQDLIASCVIFLDLKPTHSAQHTQNQPQSYAQARNESHFTSQNLFNAKTNIPTPTHIKNQFLSNIRSLIKNNRFCIASALGEAFGNMDEVVVKRVWAEFGQGDGGGGERVRIRVESEMDFGEVGGLLDSRGEMGGFWVVSFDRVAGGGRGEGLRS